MSPFKTCIWMLNVLLYFTPILSSEYTYWRYGDGSFTNSLPQNHSLFSTGLVSDLPIYKHESPGNQSYFYPLITENNEIFVLTNNYTKQSNKPYCMQPLSLTKLNEYLNETIAILPLIDSQQYHDSCYSYAYSYPIYHKQEQDEYVFVHISAQVEDWPDDDAQRSYFWIINATSMDIIANITSPIIYNDWETYYFWYPPVNTIIHNQHIIKVITSQNVYNYNILPFNTTYTAYNFQGDEIWSINTSVYGANSVNDVNHLISPIGISDKVVISIINETEYQNTKKFKLVALNVSNGDTLWNTYIPVYYIDNIYPTVVQPISYPSKNAIITAAFTMYQPVFYLFIIDAETGDIITTEMIEISFATSWIPAVYLSVSDDKLIVTNFTFTNFTCMNVQFLTYDIMENMTLNLIENTMNECFGPNGNGYSVNGGAQKPKYYFHDQIGVSLIGWVENLNIQTPEGPYENMWSMVSDDNDDGMKLMNNGKGFISSNQKGEYDELGRYPAIGSNGLIYFAGSNSIIAYEMGIVPSNNTKDYMWVYIGVGTGGLLLAILILLCVCRNGEKAEKERLINAD